MLERLSLRARLVLGVIVLAAAGLAGANVATYTSLRAFLVDRTDDSLARAEAPLERAFDEGRCPGVGGRPIPGLAPGELIQLRTEAGRIVCSAQMTDLSGALPSPPDLPASIDTTEAGDAPDRARHFTVRSRGRSGSCGASSRTPRTSCGRRSPPSGPTPSCSRAAPTGGPTTWPAR